MSEKDAKGWEEKQLQECQFLCPTCREQLVFTVLEQDSHGNTPVIVDNCHYCTSAETDFVVLVSSGDCEDYQIEGIFTTEEKAGEYIKSRSSSYEHATITAWELNYPIYTWRKVWYADVTNGVITSEPVERVFRSITGADITNIPEAYLGSTVGPIIGVRSFISAKDLMETAIKKANKYLRNHAKAGWWGDRIL